MDLHADGEVLWGHVGECVHKADVEECVHKSVDLPSSTLLGAGISWLLHGVDRESVVECGEVGK